MVGLAAFTSAPPTKEVMVVLDHFWLEFSVEFSHSWRQSCWKRGCARSGMNLMSDVTTRNTPIKESIRNRFKESGEILKRKAEEKLNKLVEGSGYKLPRQDFPLQLRFDGASVTSRKGKKRKKSSRRKNKKRNQKTSRKRKSKKRSTRQKKKKRITRDIFD